MIGIIGLGVVGKAVRDGYTELGMNGILTYDINDSGNCTSLETLVLDYCAETKYLVICLPTPREVNGDPDYSYVSNTLAELNRLGNKKPVIIKSTVSPKFLTVSELLCDFPIIANPEFLSARTAKEDFKIPILIVWGGNDENLLRQVMNDLHHPYWNIPLKLYMTSLESAMKIKLAMNSFGALKITFFNILKEWGGNDYDHIKNALIDSGWVAEQHTDVPGHDGKYGFGGACLPKDISAMRHALIAEGVSGSSLLNTVITTNDLTFRGKEDCMYCVDGVAGDVSRTCPKCGGKGHKWKKSNVDTGGEL